MSLNIPVDFCEASFVFSASEGTPPFVTTIGIDPRAIANPNKVDTANQLFDCYSIAFMPVTDADLTLDRVSLYFGPTPGGGSVDSTRPAVQGDRSVEGQPFSMAAILRKQTEVLGRRGKGRMFLPGSLASGDVAQNGQISNTRRAALQTAGDDFMAALADVDPDGLYPVLFHDASSSDVVPTPITGLSVAPLVGWIRKRIR